MLYYHFTEMIQKPGTSFESPVLKMFIIQHTQVKRSLCSNAYRDVTDFEIYGFHKNTKI